MASDHKYVYAILYYKIWYHAYNTWNAVQYWRFLLMYTGIARGGTNSSTFQEYAHVELQVYKYMTSDAR